MLVIPESHLVSQQGSTSRIGYGTNSAMVNVFHLQMFG